MPPTVAIVGAGIIGCMIAREIGTRDPDAVPVLLDRDMVGSGASRRSAGLHVPSGATDRIRRMTEYSEDYYTGLRRRDPLVPIHPLGMTVVAAESSAARLRDIYLERAGLTRTDQVAHPAVTIPRDWGAWRVDGCQYADVYTLTQALGHGLRPRSGVHGGVRPGVHEDLGAGVHEGVRVTGIELAGGGVTVRLGTGDRLHADRVVLAPGPWLNEPAWRSLVAPLGVRVKKIVALHVDQTATDHDQAVVFPDEDAFLLPIPHRGHWLFSYTCREWDVDPDAPAGGLSGQNIAEARRCLSRYAPSLAERCTSGRVFCDAYSPDREPLVRTLDDAGRIVFAGAAGGSGYRLAPAIAAEAADLLHLPSKVWSHS